MLTTHDAQAGTAPSQGRDGGGLAELRRELADPAGLTHGNRQRLLELTRRLARVQACGGEYVRVALSEHAATALAQSPAMA